MNQRFDFSRWALVAPNDDTGLGRMAQDMKAVLPLGRHLITESQRMGHRPLTDARECKLDTSASIPNLEAQMEGLQGIVFFERPGWHPQLLPTARRLGLRSVCVPMWEWFRGRSPQWQNCDFFACPNAACFHVVRSYGFQNSARIPWALDLSRFPAREVRGPARHFIHNAGFIDVDDRKGTREALRAFEQTRLRHVRLTVRVQNQERLSTRDPRVELLRGSLHDPAALYADGDAFIQPSKLEGLGFMVLEAVASGLPVITSNYPPMNEWVRQPEMLAKIRSPAFPAYSSDWIEHSHLRLPHIGDLTRRITWAAENDLCTISVQNRAWAETTFDPVALHKQWERVLTQVLTSPSRNVAEELPEPSPPSLNFESKVRRKITQFTGWKLPLFHKTLIGLDSLVNHDTIKDTQR